MEQHLPKFPLPQGYDTADHYLTDLVSAGANRLYKDTFSPEVTKRIKQELALIRSQKSADYFLVYWDLARFAKTNHILYDCTHGTTICGIVPYCLGITTIDPIQAGFLSECFMFSAKPQVFFTCQESRQQEVMDYLFSMFGEDHVSYMKTQTSDGRYEGFSTGRILMTPQPLKEYFTLTEYKGKLVPDKDAKEIYDAGFAIFDIGANSRLDKISKILSKDTMYRDLAQIPLEDEEVLDVLFHPKAKSQWCGDKRKEVYLPEIEEKTFEHLVDLTALMNQEDDTIIYTYIQYAQKRWTPIKRHPLVASYFNTTLGVWVYPEQTLRILEDICGLSGSEACLWFRHSSSQTEQADLLEQKARSNAQKRGLQESDINEIFEYRWFNRWKAWRHYNYLECLRNYQDAWLKKYYPDEYTQFM